MITLTNEEYAMLKAKASYQTPREPELCDVGYAYGHVVWATRCPKCMTKIDKRDKVCPECGQLIDWSDGKEE